MSFPGFQPYGYDSRDKDEIVRHTISVLNTDAERQLRFREARRNGEGERFTALSKDGFVVDAA